MLLVHGQVLGRDGATAPVDGVRADVHEPADVAAAVPDRGQQPVRPRHVGLEVLVVDVVAGRERRRKVDNRIRADDGPAQRRIVPKTALDEVHTRPLDQRPARVIPNDESQHRTAIGQ